MIIGTQVILAPVSLQHVELVYKWENMPDMWPISETPGPFDTDTIREFIVQSTDLKLQGQQRWIIYTATHIPVGMIDLFQYNSYTKTCGIGIMIADILNRRQGYAADAILTLIEFLEKEALVNQLNALIFEDNMASQKLFLKCGFMAKNHKLYKGQPAINYIKKLGI